ncbi:MAG: nicotinamide-nucleotide amidohydrolase family protein [Gammaproteobacteria bacterium]|nr:nicotinamide-nucleotide amidohydrolase family protein [Gammaproteobacteria bacterium]
MTDLKELVAQLAARLEATRSHIATAESCTGGGLASCLTDRPGSSAWFGYGVVTYANEAKQTLLGVDPATLAAEGAVSQTVAEQMATGARLLSGAEVAVAITGIAGPGGGSDDKPVGTVWFAWSGPGPVLSAECARIAGDRAAVRHQAVAFALAGTLARL